MSRRADVALVPLTLAHAPRIAAWMEDPMVRDNVGVRQEPSLARTDEWIRRVTTDPATVPFAVERGGRHVGNVILDCIDRYLGTTRLSVYVGEATERGAGVGTAAVALAAQHAFDALGLHKVWLTVHARNANAQRTYAAVGFVREGVLRGEFLLAGERLDAVRMGLLRHELRP